MALIRFRDKNGQEYPSLVSRLVGDFTEELSERNKLRLPLEIYSVNNKVGFVPQSEQFEEAGYLNGADTSIYMIAPPNTFAYNPARLDVGSIGYQNVGHDVQISSLYEVFRTDNQVDDLWLWYWFHSEHFKREVFRFQEGGVRQYFYYDKLEKTPILLPSLEEQKKVAAFLLLYDKRITVQASKVEALESRRKGLLQQIFSRKIRFKADDGSNFPDWESVIIDDAFTSISDKNHPDKTVLTIIQGQGTIPREESDRNISYNKETIPTYKLVKENDFIMHLRSFEGGLEIATREGIVSPAYTILRSKIDIVPEFYRYYFRSYSFIVEKLTGITEGIRDGRSINMDDFWLLEIPYPSLPEQRKISHFLSLINKQIEIEREKLEAIKSVKKGLLQQMFV